MTERWKGTRQESMQVKQQELGKKECKNDSKNVGKKIIIQENRKELGKKAAACRSLIATTNLIG